MLKAYTYSISGVKGTEISIPGEFVEKVNLKILSQALRVYEDKLHPGLSKVKTRAEVDRTKKKWYRQKGTGGARHGAKSAPIFVGGGVAHGPKGIKRILQLPERMKRKAKKIALAVKIENNEAVLVSGLSKVIKTKEIAGLIKKLKTEFSKSRKITIILDEKNIGITKFINNLKEVTPITYKNSNAYQIFNGGILLIDADVFGSVKAVKSVKKAKVVTKKE